MKKFYLKIKSYISQLHPKDHKIVYIACIVVTISMCCISYNTGYEFGKDEGRKAFLTRKGKGYHFYGEKREGFIMYHSLPDCYFVKDGIGRDNYYINDELRNTKTRFCSSCMDEELIDKCFDFLRSVDDDPDLY